MSAGFLRDHGASTDCGKEQKEIVGALRGVGAEVHRGRSGAGNGKIGLINKARAELSAQVERVEGPGLLAQPIIYQASTGWRWRRSRSGRTHRWLGGLRAYCHAFHRERSGKRTQHASV